jgi:hypothetical protein
MNGRKMAKRFLDTLRAKIVNAKADRFGIPILAEVDRLEFRGPHGNYVVTSRAEPHGNVSIAIRGGDPPYIRDWNVRPDGGWEESTPGTTPGQGGKDFRKALYTIADRLIEDLGG